MRGPQEAEVGNEVHSAVILTEYKEVSEKCKGKVLTSIQASTLQLQHIDLVV